MDWMEKVQLRYSKRRFGGNREKVLERDNYSCVDCGTNKFPVIVHHKDGGSNCLQKPYNIHRNRLKTLAFYY